MICAYLVSINFYNLPRQVMDYYSIVRTVNNKVSHDGFYPCVEQFLCSMVLD